MTDKEQLYIPANLGQVQPTKLAIRLFFTRILVVVCSGLRWVCGGLRWFACFSPPIVPNSGGGLWWFAVVCGGLWWFVIVCGGLSYSHTRVTRASARATLAIPHSNLSMRP